MQNVVARPHGGRVRTARRSRCETGDMTGTTYAIGSSFSGSTARSARSAYTVRASHRSADAGTANAFDSQQSETSTTSTISLRYSASVRQKGSEVMYFSPTLSVPDRISPAGISATEVDTALAG